MSESTTYRFPSRIADLGFTVALPAGWTVAALPEEHPNFDVPNAMMPLAIVHAPWAAIVFAFATRPAWSDGTLLDWTRYLLEENGLQPQALGLHAVGPLPAWVGEASQESELGPLRIRFAFVEDGGRLLNITLTAPEALAGTVQAAWFEALASFILEEPRGATVLAAPPVEAPEPENVPGACTVAEDPEPPPVPAQGPSRGGSDGLPAWWHEAQRLESENRLDEAERAVIAGAQHIGACITIAGLYRDRMDRLRAAGDLEGAREARGHAVGWAQQYAASATSGGEGAALSQARDAFIESLGPAF